MKVLITGAAGFIGSRVAEMLAEAGIDVLGVDNINDYYDPHLKLARLKRCGISLPIDGRLIDSSRFENLQFVKQDVCSRDFENIATEFRPDVVVHLAAQPGVRYSVTNPEECIQANVITFMRVLEVSRRINVRRLIYASSSSVYGNHSPHAFRESDSVESPQSVYAASKRTNELLAGVYADMYGIRMIGLRFFSVYGEWGRPDMAPYLFADAILHNKPIRLFNGGQLSRDFTYIDDVAECVKRIVTRGGGIASIGERHEVLNIGNGSPTLLTDFVAHLEKIIGKRALTTLLPMQPGEVKATLADTSKLNMQYGFIPTTPLRVGLRRFINWLLTYEASQPTSSEQNDSFEKGAV